MTFSLSPVAGLSTVTLVVSATPPLVFRSASVTVIVIASVGTMATVALMVPDTPALCTLVAAVTTAGPPVALTASL